MTAAANSPAQSTDSPRQVVQAASRGGALDVSGLISITALPYLDASILIKLGTPDDQTHDLRRAFPDGERMTVPQQHLKRGLSRVANATV